MHDGSVGITLSLTKFELAMYSITQATKAVTGNEMGIESGYFYNAISFVEFFTALASINQSRGKIL